MTFGADGARCQHMAKPYICRVARRWSKSVWCMSSSDLVAPQARSLPPQPTLTAGDRPFVFWSSFLPIDHLLLAVCPPTSVPHCTVYWLDCCLPLSLFRSRTRPPHQPLPTHSHAAVGTPPRPQPSPPAVRFTPITRSARNFVGLDRSRHAAGSETDLVQVSHLSRLSRVDAWSRQASTNEDGIPSPQGGT